MNSEPKLKIGDLIMNSYDVQKKTYEIGFVIAIKKQKFYRNLRKSEIYFYTILWAGESVGLEYVEDDVMVWRKIYLAEIERLGLKE